MNVNSLSNLEILLLLIIFAFIFSTALINLLYLEPNEDDDSKMFLIVFSYISIVLIGGLPLIFLLFLGGQKTWKSLSSYQHGGEKGALQQILGFEDTGWAVVLFIVVLLLLIYSAFMLHYVNDHEDTSSTCPHPHQYLYACTIIMLSFSALLVLIMSITGLAHAVHWGQKTNKNVTSYNTSSYSSTYKYNFT